MKNYSMKIFIIICFSLSICYTQTPVRVMRHGDTDSFVNSVKFLPQGEQLISSSDNGTVISWDTKTGKVNWKNDFDNNSKKASPENYTISTALAMDVSPNGKFIATAYTHSKVVNGWLKKGEEFNIAVLNAEDGKELKNFKGSSSRALRLAFSPDSNLLTSGGPDGKVYVWDLNAATQIQVISCIRGISALSFSNDGKTLLIGQAGANSIQNSNKNDVILWDLQTNKEIESLSINSRYVNDAMYSMDGKYIAVIGQIPDEITLFDAKTLQIIKSLKSPQIGVNRLIFSLDSKQIAFYDSSYESNAGIVFLWDIEKKIKPNQINISGSSIEAIGLSQSGKELAIGTDNGKIMLYRLKK